MSRAQRVFDVLGASAGVVVFTPVMAAIAAAILLDDGGPVLFRQERIGYRRQPFDVLKFRSMRDGEVTRVGRVLRATGLDELPQFVNIVRGDMSAVGPRPLTAADITRLGWDDPSCDFRWSCRPGLTGLAQLMGARADEDALIFDRVHAGGWQWSLDCQLIAWSFAVNVFGKTRVRAWLRSIYGRGVTEGTVPSAGMLSVRDGDSPQANGDCPHLPPRGVSAATGRRALRAGRS